MNKLSVEHRIIQVLMLGVGVAAVVIGSMVFVMGVQVIQLTESSFNLATGLAIPPDPAMISPTLDNEFRFYAVFWFSYGVILLWVARNILAQLRFVPILMGLFFLGGIGRYSLIFLLARHIRPLSYSWPSSLSCLPWWQYFIFAFQSTAWRVARMTSPTAIRNWLNVTLRLARATSSGISLQSRPASAERE